MLMQFSANRTVSHNIKYREMRNLFKSNLYEKMEIKRNKKNEKSGKREKDDFFIQNQY